MVDEQPDAGRRSLENEVHDDGPQVLAPVRPPASCPIGWQPNALTPVFWGMRILGTADGAPVPLRIFFPTIEHTTKTARILEGCGRYPVVVFYHGQCNSDLLEHYEKWALLPARLAKSGYVVVVPQVPSINLPPGSENHPALATMADLLRWVREAWEHRSVLMPSPATAVVGHSWGGLLVGRFSAASGEVAAFASLSSGWEHEATQAALEELKNLTIPKLFLGGGRDAESLLSPSLWEALALPKHRAVFAEAGHWDYLPHGPSGCSGQSPCPHFPVAAFDLVNMFLAKYLPPDLSVDLPDRVPDSLRPPTPLALTPEQQFYVGGRWLTAMDLMTGEPECGIALDWVTPDTRIVPFVRFLPAALADQQVRQRDLQPLFSGPNTSESWVFTQSPVPGRRVTVGDTVRMRLKTGPVP
jgi:pimeloyl-ACP methyl ester carboxylesterase